MKREALKAFCTCAGMTKVEEMDEQSVIRYCPRYCKENNLTNEFEKYRLARNSN